MKDTNEFFDGDSRGCFSSGVTDALEVVDLRGCLAAGAADDAGGMIFFAARELLVEVGTIFGYKMVTLESSTINPHLRMLSSSEP